MTGPTEPIPFALTPAGSAALLVDPIVAAPSPRLANPDARRSRTVVITPAGHAALARPRSTDLPEEPRRARPGSAR